jgi:hypothetical protein
MMPVGRLTIGSQVGKLPHMFLRSELWLLRIARVRLEHLETGFLYGMREHFSGNGIAGVYLRRTHRHMFHIHAGHFLEHGGQARHASAAAHAFND